MLHMAPTIAIEVGRNRTYTRMWIEHGILVPHNGSLADLSFFFSWTYTQNTVMLHHRVYSGGKHIWGGGGGAMMRQCAQSHYMHSPLFFTQVVCQSNLNSTCTYGCGETLLTHVKHCSISFWASQCGIMYGRCNRHYWMSSLSTILYLCTICDPWCDSIVNVHNCA